MTIDEERLRAINATREYLYEKIKGRTKLRNRKERARVLGLLRRYPEKYWVDDVWSMLKLATNLLSDTDKMQRLTRALAKRCGLEVVEMENECRKSGGRK